MRTSPRPASPLTTSPPLIRSAKELENHHLHARDGEIGRLKGLYFDDRWSARYFIVETGSWLDIRQVLISTKAVDRLEWDRHTLPVRLTREQVRDSPPVDTTKPISRRTESVLNRYYGWTRRMGSGHMCNNRLNGRPLS